jgi:hypothetical protein
MFRKDRRAVGGELASDIVVVLDRDRQACEPARMVGGLAAKGFRLRARLVEETDGQGVNVGLHGSYARGRSLHHLQRRHLGPAKFVDGFRRRKLPELAHLLVPLPLLLPIP